MSNLTAALSYLRSNRVKKGDPPEVAARSDRMAAIVDAILGLAGGGHMRRGPGVRLRTSEGMVTITADVGGGGGGGGGDIFPFTIEATANEFGDKVWTISPGRVCTVIPTLNGIEITEDDPVPMHALDDNTEFSIFLKIEIDQSDPDTAHQNSVKEVTVVTDDEIGDELPTGDEVEEGIVKWDSDDESESKGHFFIKVADVSNKPDPEDHSDKPESITKIHQFLMTNIGTFIVADDQAIIIATA